MASMSFEAPGSSASYVLMASLMRLVLVSIISSWFLASLDSLCISSPSH